MVILCLFPSKAFAELGLIKTPDGHVRLAGVISSRPNGIITAKVIGGNYVHGTAESLSLRSATSGAVSSAKVPATISRTVPKATVLRNLLSRTKLARLTPQGLVGGLILGEILTMLEDDGYQYDDASGEFLSSSEYLVRVYTIGNAGKIHLVKQRGMVSNLGISNYGVVVDQLCRDAWDIIKPSLPNYQRYRYLRYDGVETGSCVVALGNDERNFYSWDVVRNPNRLLTPAEYERIVSPLLQQRPEAILEAAQLPDSEWSQPKVHVLPGTIVNSQPYTDSKDGKAKQARWQFYDCDDGQSCVQETLIDRPDLQPNSPEAPAPDNPPANGSDTVPGTGGQSGSQSGNQTGTEQPPPFDLCKEHPEILACQQMGQPDPGQFDDIKIPVHVDNRTWQEDLFLPSTGVCPAPKTFHVMGKPVSVSYQPLCSFMETIRFIVLICFIVSAAYISFGGLKQG